MPTFKGQYEHSVDSKGRVSFPAKLRKMLTPEAQESFTILRGLDRWCLYIYPQDEWQKVIDNRLSKVDQFSREGRIAMRDFLRYAEDIKLDKQNRISLPRTLSDWVEIDDKVVFIGSGERIEVWAPHRLEEMDAELSFESYQEIFERVMTNNDVSSEP